MVLRQVQFFFDLALAAAQLLVSIFVLERRPDLFAQFFGALLRVGNVSFQFGRPLVKALNGHFE